MSYMYDSQVTSQLSNYMLSERITINKFRATFDSLLSSSILYISKESSMHNELRPLQIVESETNVKKDIDAICFFTNPFNTERCAEELYCLYIVSLIENFFPICYQQFGRSFVRKTPYNLLFFFNFKSSNHSSDENMT